MLKAKMFNLVGEFHKESRVRRDKEKKFCKEKVGADSGYWIESQFPDLPKGGRGNVSSSSSSSSWKADGMEYRAMHSTAILINDLHKLLVIGTRVSELDLENDENAQQMADFSDAVEKLRMMRNDLAGTWKPSNDPVIQAAQEVYGKMDAAFTAYSTAFGNSKIVDQQEAIRDLCDKWSYILDMVPGLATVTKAKLDNNQDPAELAKYLRRQRSINMALGAKMSSQKGIVGVWKVGDGHIQDLRSGAIKVETSYVNIVTSSEFNDELNVWKPST